MVPLRDTMRHLAVLIVYLLVLRAEVSDDGSYTLGDQIYKSFGLVVLK